MGKSRLAIFGLVALAALWIVHFSSRQVRQFGSIDGHTAASLQGASALVRSLRPSYPHSVIPGGAYSPAELRFAARKDSVVRSHYAGFDMQHARVVRLVDDRYQYLSYRIKDQIYWTARKLLIPSGELLLTDGVQYARARCGNRLSAKSHGELTSTQEPSAAVLSLPAVSLELLPRLALANPPEAHSMSTDSRTAAALPSPLTLVAGSTVLPGAAYIPMAPVWGGQSLTGDYAPHPALAEGPPDSTAPLKAPGGAGMQPVLEQVAMVPEPASIYLFLLTLFFAGWAFVQMAPGDDVEETPSEK